MRASRLCPGRTNRTTLRIAKHLLKTSVTVVDAIRATIGLPRVTAAVRPVQDILPNSRAKLLHPHRRRKGPTSLLLRGLRNGAPLTVFRYDEFQEAEIIRGAWVPVRVDRAGRNKEAVARVQCYRGFSVFLPDARA